MMACDPSCGSAYLQGGLGCGGGMMGAMDMSGMGYPGAGGGCCQPIGFQQGTPMGYKHDPSLGFQQGPMGYQQGPQGYQPDPSLGFQQGPMGYQQGPQGYQPFEPGSGCGGLSIPCGSQGADIPPQARARKPRPPNSNIPKRKVGTSYTTLVTPLAGAKKLVEEEAKDIPPDHERFDTLTLAFGTKPGTDKPPKILLTLKSPKVIDAKLGTGTAGTQVHYRDLGLPDPGAKPDDTKSRGGGSRGSKRSKHSISTKKTKGSKTKKPSKGKKGKK